MKVLTFKREVMDKEDNEEFVGNNTLLTQKKCVKDEFDDGSENKNNYDKDKFIFKQGIKEFTNDELGPHEKCIIGNFQFLSPWSDKKSDSKEILKEDCKDETAVIDSSLNFDLSHCDKSDDMFYCKEECKSEFPDWNEDVIREEIIFEDHTSPSKLFIKSPESSTDIREELHDEIVDPANEQVVNERNISMEETIEKLTCPSNKSNVYEESNHHRTVCEESFKLNQGLKHTSCNNSTLKAKIKEHPCSECGKTFRFQKELKIHIDVFHNSDNLKCFYCLMTFDKKSALKSHMQSHKAVFKHDYVCVVCGRVFNFQSNLARHMKLHSGLKPYICETCGKGFIRLDHLKLHKRMRKHQEFVGKIDVKNNKTQQKEALDVEEFVCVICGRAFRVKQRLCEHLKLHTENRPHICQVCNRAFKQLYNLQQHLLSHDGPRDFICDICNKGFRRKAFLKQHMLVHTKEKKYICELCGKKYYKSCHVTEHKRKAHSEPDTAPETELEAISLTCDTCNKVFHRKAALARHVLTHLQ